jgi:hypothetical protein
MHHPYACSSVFTALVLSRDFVLDVCFLENAKLVSNLCFYVYGRWLTLVSVGGEAAPQVFWKITQPFLKPAILSAATLAFMQSFENYNTTLFAVGFEQTLVKFRMY